VAAILLVDDVPIVRTTLRKFLERGGHVVTECGGGEEGWALFSRNNFDIVVTDLWMKEGGGLEFIQRLRSNGHSTPVIAVTSGGPRTSLSASTDVAIRAGATRILLKPVTSTALLSAVSELVEHQDNEIGRSP
jgi:two-component system chemotaxis response regulator CheY